MTRNTSSARLQPSEAHPDPGATVAADRRTTGVRLFRVAGIEIRAQWSLLGMVALIASSLALGLVTDLDQDVSIGIRWVGGVTGAIVFLAGLLAHELSHSLVARRHGVEVRSITLWLLGGMAMMERDAPDARAALRIAIAGPIASFVLAGAAGTATLGMSLLDTGSDVVAMITAVLQWLAIVNVALGAFNLLPGAPLDGGRVLRAWYWMRTGDRYESQARAARAGRTLAHVLIAFGLVEFAFGAGASGLWIAFIGWFVLSAAAVEESDARLHQALGRAPIDAVMTRDPTTVEATTAVSDLVEGFLLRHRSAYPVVEDGALIGLVTLDDVRKVPLAERATHDVRAITTPLAHCAIAHAGEPAAAVLERLGAARRILVLDDGRLTGIVTPTDLTRLLAGARLRSGH